MTSTPFPTLPPRGYLTAWSGLALTLDLLVARETFLHRGRHAQRKRQPLETVEGWFAAARVVDREIRFRASGEWRDNLPPDELEGAD